MQTHVKILFKLRVIVCVHPERQTESWFEIDLAGNAPTPIFAWICWPPCCSSSEEKLIATSELDSSFPGEYFCLADTHSFHHLILSVSRTHGHTSMLLGILFQYAFTTSVSGSVIYKSGHGPRRGRGLLSREPIRLLETLHYSLLVLHFEKSS